MTVSIRRGLLAAVSAIALTIGVAPASYAQEVVSADAELAAKGAWNATATYAKDDIVTARGSAWISLRAGNRNKVPGQTTPTTATWWRLFARGFNPTGAWSNATKYQPDDLVTHNGQTWRAKVTQSNRQPAANQFWELLAQRGAAGANGAQGPTGPAGPNTGIGAGDQNSPSISFNGDPNTGIFSPSDGHIALVENGALVLHNTGTTNTALGRNAMGENYNLGGVGFGNTAVGAAALFAVTSTGLDNTAVGQSALLANTDGGNNTAVGKNALTSSLTGSNNVAVGRSALSGSTTGFNNVALGFQALLAGTTHNNNVAIGRSALENNTANFNIGIGSNALFSNLSGTRNTAVGFNTLQGNLTSNGNTAVGYSALLLTTGESNTAVGAGTLVDNIAGAFNVALGTDALANNTSGNGNVAIGSSALGANLTTDGNVAVGSYALAANATGGANVAVGTSALSVNTDGLANIAIGYQAGWNATSPDDSIFIGNAGQALDTNTIKIGTDGLQTTTFIAGILGATVGDSQVMIDSSTGQLGVGSSSSERYKYDIQTMADVSATLAKFRPVTFRYNQARSDGSHPLQYGLIAEEVAKIAPDLAIFDRDGRPDGVKYHLLPSFLLAGYQTQQKTIATQAEKIDALEERLRRLEALLPQTKAASLQ